MVSSSTRNDHLEDDARRMPMLCEVLYSTAVLAGGVPAAACRRSARRCRRPWLRGRSRATTSSMTFISPRAKRCRNCACTITTFGKPQQRCARPRHQRRADPARHRGIGPQLHQRPVLRRAVQARGNCSMRTSTTSSCRTASATENRASRATACTMRFPQYAYADMVARAVRAWSPRDCEVNHLRLVMGTSMGCMHTFMWGEAIRTSWTR